MLLIIRFTANSVIHGHQNDQQKHGNELVGDAETQKAVAKRSIQDRENTQNDLNDDQYWYQVANSIPAFRHLNRFRTPPPPDDHNEK